MLLVSGAAVVPVVVPVLVLVLSVLVVLSVFLLQPTAARATVRIAIMRSIVSFLVT